jgi:predicted nucleic acid-binding protein
MTPILVDTNVLVYAHDRGEFVKQEQAICVLEHLHRTGSGYLSVQCLAEFFSITTRGAKPKLTTAEAAQQVEWFARSWPVLELTPMIVLEAVRGVCDHKLAYWDSQLWATARLNQIRIILGEDFNVGAVLEGVRFVNPFATDFVVEALP